MKLIPEKGSTCVQYDGINIYFPADLIDTPEKLADLQDTLGHFCNVVWFDICPMCSSAPAKINGMCIKCNREISRHSCQSPASDS